MKPRCAFCGRGPPPLSDLKMTPRDRWACVGLTGSGKTFFSNENVVKPAKRAACWDPHRNYQVTYYPSVDKVPATALRWGISVDYLDSETFLTEFEKYVRYCVKTRQPLTLVDELILLLRSKRGVDLLVMLITQARNQGVACHVNIQRAYDVDLTMRSQLSRVVTFQQTHPNDVRGLNIMVGDPDFAKLCSKPAADKHGNRMPCEWEPEHCIKHFITGEYKTAALRG